MGKVTCAGKKQCGREKRVKVVRKVEQLVERRVKKYKDKATDVQLECKTVLVFLLPGTRPCHPCVFIPYILSCVYFTEAVMNHPS